MEDADEIIRKYKGKYVPEIHGKSSSLFYGTFSEAILTAVMDGNEIKVHDVEDPDKDNIGILSHDTIQKGINNMIKDNRPELIKLLTDDADYDASDADVIFQYFTLGELVY